VCDVDDRGAENDVARGAVIQTFTIGLGHRWWAQVFRSNPLVRRSDRIEVLVFSGAVMCTVVAIPVAGALGTFVHDARTRGYAEEALTRHEVTATAVEPGVIVVQPPRGVSFSARAKWVASGRDHSGVVNWSDQAEISDQQAIWMNDAGENVGPPSPPSRADVDAVAIAILVWFAVANASAGLVYVVGRWLDRWRYTQWDRQINEFRSNDGRTNHQS
jgi:hypothetical protein